MSEIDLSNLSPDELVKLSQRIEEEDAELPRLPVSTRSASRGIVSHSVGGVGLMLSFQAQSGVEYFSMADCSA